jgi:hypothetical protein
MTQTKILLDHLRSGRSITQLEAIGLYRVFNLKGRINDLRKDGHEIVTDMTTDTTGKRYARYRLVQPKSLVA